MILVCFVDYEECEQWPHPRLIDPQREASLLDVLACVLRELSIDEEDCLEIGNVVFQKAVHLFHAPVAGVGAGDEAEHVVQGQTQYRAELPVNNVYGLSVDQDITGLEITVLEH